MPQHSGPAAPVRPPAAAPVRPSAAASWPDDRTLGDVLAGIRALARFRPGLVMTGAAFAGLVVGRVTRRLPVVPGGRRSRDGGQP